MDIHPILLAIILTEQVGRFFALPAWMPTNVPSHFVADGRYQDGTTNGVEIARLTTTNAALVASGFDGMFERWYLGANGMKTMGQECFGSWEDRHLFDVAPTNWPKTYLASGSDGTPYQDAWNDIVWSGFGGYGDNTRRLTSNDTARLVHYANQCDTRRWLDGATGKNPNGRWMGGFKEDAFLSGWGGDAFDRAIGTPGGVNWQTFSNEMMAPTNNTVSFYQLINELPTFGGLAPDGIVFRSAPTNSGTHARALRVWPKVWTALDDLNVNSSMFKKTVGDLLTEYPPYGANAIGRYYHTASGGGDAQVVDILAVDCGYERAMLEVTNHWALDTVRLDWKQLGMTDALIADMQRRYDHAPGDEFLRVHCAGYYCYSDLHANLGIPDGKTAVIGADPQSASYITNLFAEVQADSESFSASSGNAYGYIDNPGSEFCPNDAGGGKNYQTYDSSTYTYRHLYSYPRIRFGGVTATYNGSWQVTFNIHGPTRNEVYTYAYLWMQYLLDTFQYFENGMPPNAPIYLQVGMQFAYRPGEVVVEFFPLAVSAIGADGSAIGWNPVNEIFDATGSTMPKLEHNLTGWPVYKTDMEDSYLNVSVEKRYNCDTTAYENSAADVMQRIPKPEDELGSWPVTNIWCGAPGDVLNNAKAHVGETVVACERDVRSSTSDGIVRYSMTSTNDYERFSAFTESTMMRASDVPYVRYGILSHGNTGVESAFRFFKPQVNWPVISENWVLIDLEKNPDDQKFIAAMVKKINDEIKGNKWSGEWYGGGAGGWERMGPAGSYEYATVVLKVGPPQWDVNGNFIGFQNAPQVMSKTGTMQPMTTNPSTSCQDHATYDNPHYDLIRLIIGNSVYQVDPIVVTPPFSADARQRTLVEKRFKFKNLQRRYQ